MKNYLALRFLDLFKFLFNLFGYDYSEIRLILQLKITEGSRRSLMQFSQTKKREKERKINFSFENIFFLVFGLLFASMSAILAVENPFTSFTFLYSIIAFFTLMILFTEFSITFFDMRDADFLLPTPIKPESLSIAKNLYLFSTFFRLAMLMSLPSILFYGYFFNAFIVIPIVIMIVAEIFLLIAITSILFGILLKIFSGERLKDFTGYLQIAISLILFVGYQLALNNEKSVNSLFEGELPSALYFIPTSWFAAFPALFVKDTNFSLMLKLSIIAFSFSIIGYFLFAKVIAPFFEKNLFKLKINVSRPKKKRELILFPKFFDKFEFGAFYHLSNKIINSDRKIKMTIYPAVFLSIFFPMLMLYRAFKEQGANLCNTKYFYVVYILSFMTIQIYMIIFHSSYYKASWIFRYLPIKSPKPIFLGADFALFMRFQFPIILILNAVVLKLWGLHILPELIVILLNSLLMILMFLILSDKYLPFSQKFIGNKSLSYRSSSYLLITFIIFPIFGLIHYLFTLFFPGVYILIPLQIVALLFMWHGFTNSLIWNEVKE